MSFQQPDMSRLVVGGIYILVFFRNLDVNQGFHWGLYHHLDPYGGFKYNIKSMDNLGTLWIADFARTNGVLKSSYLIGLMRIGHCDPINASVVYRIADSVTLNVAPPGYSVSTCRTWTMSVVQLLASAMIVRCYDFNRLELEITQWASGEHPSATVNIQPRPIVDSTTCFLN